MISNPSSFENLIGVVNQTSKAEDINGNLTHLTIIFRDPIQEYTATKGSVSVTSKTNPVNIIPDIAPGFTGYEIYLELNEFGSVQTEKDYNAASVSLKVEAGGQNYEFDLTTDLFQKIYWDLFK
ncbi:hypothetical protein [Sporosarcina psychrophila]|uniref:BppU N-terminal domain-containing protein n=1 Tax=Sporosarcina psychrophila TaxID=1476 RepID=A0ABV2K2T1_SPOPS